MDPLPLDHIAIAVPSIREAALLFEHVTGATGSPAERVESQGVEVAFLPAGAVRIELIQPLAGDSGVARFLERRGPGLHHIAFRVPDLDAALARLERAGVRLIDRTPRPGAGGHRVAFLHPSAMGGVLVELVEGTSDEPGR